MKNENLIEALTKAPVESTEFAEAVATYERLDASYDDLDDDACEIMDGAYVELCQRFGDERLAELAEFCTRIGHCRVFRIFQAHTVGGRVSVSEFKALHTPLVNHARGHMKACRSRPPAHRKVRGVRASASRHEEAEARDRLHGSI